MKNPWIRHLPIGEDPEWLAADLIRIPLSQIEDYHLLNIERMLLGRGRANGRARQHLFSNWYDVIRNEVERRGLELLRDDHPQAKMRQERGQGRKESGKEVGLGRGADSLISACQR